MQRSHAAVAVLLIVLAAMPRTSSAETPSADLKAVVNGNTRFAVDLYSKLKDAEEGNLFLSPLSISTALAMTYGGARGNTAKEMAEALHFALGQGKLHPAFAELQAGLDRVQKKGEVQLHTANSLWPQKDYPFQQDYLSLVEKHYGSPITPVDYETASEEARKIINKWVEKQTKEKIKNLIRQGDLDPATVLVLVNAIYFKGNWASQFDPDRTSLLDFTLRSGEKKQVPTMQQRGKFAYGELEDVQVLELPYEGKELSMLIVLPRDPKGLPEIENTLSAENIESWLSRPSQQKVHVYLPKFKISWGTFDLKKPLEALGVRDAFSEKRADFSGMDATKTLFIALILHKAFVEVNEEGTEAAAATAVAVSREVPQMYIFRADHPFLFMIRDNTTRSILFLGRVVDPSAQGD